MYLLADTFVPHTKAYGRVNLVFFPSLGRKANPAFRMSLAIFTGMTGFPIDPIESAAKDTDRHRLASFYSVL